MECPREDPAIEPHESRSPRPAIRDLAVIGDCRTAAVLERNGDIVWYCPDRFDRPSLFAKLLDDDRGGGWRLDFPGSQFAGRNYVGESGVLETRLRAPEGNWQVTDFMPVGQGVPCGMICRLFSAAPADVSATIEPRPNYGRDAVQLRSDRNAIVINEGCRLYASHPLVINGGVARFELPQGDSGWAMLSDTSLPEAPSRSDVERWRNATLEHWRSLAEMASYTGPYERAVLDSLRAIRLLCHEASGGIVAAATTSLPEVIGGSSNWDYRYVWLRDAGMIVSALTRLGGDITEGERYLDFLCDSRGSSPSLPMAVFTTIDGKRAPDQEPLDFAGYGGSRPVRVGNGARDQLQLDGFANVVLAAKLIYRRSGRRPHWDTVAQICEFLVEHWREPDHGIWEELPKRQYTANKVIAACALSSAAEFSDDAKQVERWRAAVHDIRAFVAERCINGEGAYAAVAGGAEVDLSAALFPVWGYTEADAPEMIATMSALEKHWSWRGLLYRRRLECADSREEGAFLAGTFWVAQYWVMRGDLARARRIIDEALGYANDLGLFSEEADIDAQCMLGNLPQAFAHAALIGAVIDLVAAYETAGKIP